MTRAEAVRATAEMIQRCRELGLGELDVPATVRAMEGYAPSRKGQCEHFLIDDADRCEACGAQMRQTGPTTWVTAACASPGKDGGSHGA